MKLPCLNQDIGLLALRIIAGGCMIPHGWGKLANFSSYAPKFMSFMGLGQEISLSLAIGAEFFAAICIVLGIFTRFATVPLIITMAVAFFMVHGGDPWSKKELAFLYLGMYTTLFFTGGGKYTFDKSWRR